MRLMLVVVGRVVGVFIFWLVIVAFLCGNLSDRKEKNGDDCNQFLHSREVRCVSAIVFCYADIFKDA